MVDCSISANGKRFTLQEARFFACQPSAACSSMGRRDRLRELLDLACVEIETLRGEVEDLKLHLRHAIDDADRLRCNKQIGCVR